jgi:hypothetical protein
MMKVYRPVTATMAQGGLIKLEQHRARGVLEGRRKDRSAGS